MIDGGVVEGVNGAEVMSAEGEFEGDEGVVSAGMLESTMGLDDG
ncbi:hypothetical protein A2U01_0090514 [Trifolium medium]|uniref:Uncharacterized protein n=1 Tax=Trifolium medium TaxID=97028 RepID=A0A392U6Y9_9FABA|nr:hypothetical protein [Trifolium medium]